MKAGTNTPSESTWYDEQLGKKKTTDGTFFYCYFIYFSLPYPRRQRTVRSRIAPHTKTYPVQASRCYKSLLIEEFLGYPERRSIFPMEINNWMFVFFTLTVNYKTKTSGFFFFFRGVSVFYNKFNFNKNYTNTINNSGARGWGQGEPGPPHFFFFFCTYLKCFFFFSYI